MQPFMQYFCDDIASTNQEITTITKLRFVTHICVLCMWNKNIAVRSVQPGTFNKLGEKIKQTLPGLYSSWIAFQETGNTLGQFRRNFPERGVKFQEFKRSEIHET